MSSAHADDVIPDLEPWVGVSIDVLNLTSLAHNGLVRANKRSVAMVAASTEKELLRIRQFGAVCVAEVREQLARLGLGLADVVSPDLAPYRRPPKSFVGLYLGMPVDEAVASQLDTVERLRHLAAEAAAADPDARLGDVMAAVVSGHTAGWLSAPLADDLKYTSASRFAGDLVSSYLWADTIIDSFNSLTPRDRVIVEQASRWDNPNRPTMAEAMAQWNITRARIDQIVQRARWKLSRPTVVNRAARRLVVGLLDPVCSRSVLAASGFDPDELATRLLAHVAVELDLLPVSTRIDRVVQAGAAWFSRENVDPADLLEELVTAARLEDRDLTVEQFTTASEALLEGHASLDEISALIDDVLVTRCAVFENVVISWRGGYVARMLCVLRVRGAPMTREELVGLFSPDKHRSVAASLLQAAAAGDLVRTDDGRFTLPDPGGPS